MLGVRDGATIGKCQWCNCKIIEGAKSIEQRFAKIINVKWYCGKCLYALKPTVDDIAEVYDAVSDILEAAGGPTLRLDPKTGRLERT